MRQHCQALRGGLARVVEFFHVAKQNAEVVVELRDGGAAAHW